jgi:hypothetical protein
MNKNTWQWIGIAIACVATVLIIHYVGNLDI